jgi:hypothetical protein
VSPGLLADSPELLAEFPRLEESPTAQARSLELLELLEAFLWLADSLVASEARLVLQRALPRQAPLTETSSLNFSTLSKAFSYTSHSLALSLGCPSVYSFR